MLFAFLMFLWTLCGFENITEKEIRKLAMNYLLSYDFKKSESITDKWGLYRQIYMENLSDIMETSKNDYKKMGQ